MNAMKILNTSTLLIKEDCAILDGMLYEKIGDCRYRVFFSEDDYDYVEDDVMIRQLNKVFRFRYK